MKKLIIVMFISISFFSNASATEAGPGMITNIHFMDDGCIIFVHSGTRSASNPCHPDKYDNRWAIDASTEAGRTQLAGLLSAYTLGKKIKIIGKGTCSPCVTNTEAVDYFYTSD